MTEPEISEGEREGARDLLEALRASLKVNVTGAQTEAPRGHILTVTKCEDFDPEYPSFDWSIECQNVDKCGGWQECHELHEISGASAADGPWDCDENAPWEGMDEFEFHGVLHTWHWGHGWTVPYRGCVVAGNDWICDYAHDIALDHGCGRHEVEDDWDDMDCYLIHVRALASSEPES